MGILVQVASRSEDLCLSCGLCCDGSLFWAVPLEPGEDLPAQLAADGRLRQPCACFNGACTIYADRPAACRSFDCRVLQTVQAGHRDAAWAREQIAGMRRVLAALNTFLPGREPSLYRRAADFLAKHQEELRDPAFQRKHRNLLQCLAAYETALARFHVTAKRRQK